MDRLTARSPNNNMAYLVGVKSNEQDLEGSYNTLVCIRDAFEKLAQYEETGLSPEDAKELNNFLGKAAKEYLNNEPLTIEDLREMDNEPVWTDKRCGVVRAKPDKRTDMPAIHFNYGWEWACDVLACGSVYRRKPTC